MRVRIKSVPRDKVLDLEMSRYMHSFLWNKANLDADYALVAYFGLEPVGVFIYSIRMNKMWAQGTYVEKRYRRMGIGRKLWSRATRDLSNPTVDVTTLSREGSEFVRHVFDGKSVSVVHTRN